MQTAANARRFGGIARLYGPEVLTRLRQARVCVVGVGGVGSWVVEALARSGIGHLRLIDLDHIAESNINRQLQALEPDLGKAKVVALAERIAQIDATIEVTPIEAFVEPDNLAMLLAPDADWVIDCIDQFRNKAALIAHCRQQQLNLVSVGGAGGRRDPSQVCIADLSRTTHDPLLSKLRTHLRQDYGFPRDLKQRFEVPCIYSTEALAVNTSATARSGLQCSGYGSVVTVTATYGFMAASVVLNQLAEVSNCVLTGNPVGPQICGPV